MSDPRKKVKQHLASIRTSINNTEGRIIELLQTYAPDIENPEIFYDALFNNGDLSFLKSREKYVLLLIMMHFYNNEVRKVLDEYDIIV